MRLPQFLAILAAFAAALVVQNRHHLLEKLAGQVKCLALFVFVYFAGYLLLYAWWAPIGAGARFAPAHFLPARFAQTFFLSRESVSRMAVMIGGLALRTDHVWSLSILLIILNILFEVPAKVVYMYWGR